MRARCLSLLLCLSACRAADRSPPSPSEWTGVDSARIDSILAPLVSSHDFMGAVAFVRNGTIVYTRGAGLADATTGRPFTPATPADGGSLAKTLTAAAVWTLVQQGRIAIDTPVTTYIPDYPHAATTVRQLIAHSNGLAPYYEEFDPYFRSNEVRTTEGLLDVVRRVMPRPRFTPGTRFEYSNLGFDAAALVVEKVTRQPIASVFRERFFAPLGMETAFARPGRFADFPGPRTRGHRWADTGWVTADVFDNEAFIGGSNVYLSALDIAKWAGAHAAGTALPAGVVRLGQVPPKIDGRPSPITGLSWYCDAAGVRCQYSGANGAFHSLAWWDRAQGTAIAMVSNSDLAPWTLITLQRDLVAALERRDPDSSPRPVFVSVTAQQRGSPAGRYTSPDGDRITVTNAPENLRLRIGNGLDFEIFHVAPDAFYVPGLDYFIGFSGDGATRRMHVRSMFEDFIATRVR